MAPLRETHKPCISLVTKRPTQQDLEIRAYVAGLRPGDLVWHGMGYRGNSSLGRVVAVDLAGDFPLVVATFSDCNNPHREYVEQFNADGYALHGDTASGSFRIIPSPPVPYEYPDSVPEKKLRSPALDRVLDSAPWFTESQVERLMGLTPPRHRVLSLWDPAGETRYPAYQFSPAYHSNQGVAPIMEHMLRISNLHHYRLAAWLSAPNLQFESQPPSHWLHVAPSRVLRAFRESLEPQTHG